jgi:hypothetical protein
MTAYNLIEQVIVDRLRALVADVAATYNLKIELDDQQLLDGFDTLLNAARPSVPARPLPVDMPSTTMPLGKAWPLSPMVGSDDEVSRMVERHPHAELPLYGAPPLLVPNDKPACTCLDGQAYGGSHVSGCPSYECTCPLAADLPHLRGCPMYGVPE